jgi:hypothetical protein
MWFLNYFDKKLKWEQSSPKTNELFSEIRGFRSSTKKIEM